MVTGGLDYDSGPYMVRFSAGVTSVLINVSIINDVIMEHDENFDLTINSSSLPSDVVVANPHKATVTIVNDDGK